MESSKCTVAVRAFHLSNLFSLYYLQGSSTIQSLTNVALFQVIPFANYFPNKPDQKIISDVSFPSRIHRVKRPQHTYLMYYDVRPHSTHTFPIVTHILPRQVPLQTEPLYKITDQKTRKLQGRTVQHSSGYLTGYREQLVVRQTPWSNLHVLIYE